MNSTEKTPLQFIILLISSSAKLAKIHCLPPKCNPYTSIFLFFATPVAISQVFNGCIHETHSSLAGDPISIDTFTQGGHVGVGVFVGVIHLDGDFPRGRDDCAGATKL